jgi:S1-C subfamily serine protease
VKVAPIGPGNNANAGGQVSGVVVKEIEPNSPAANYLQEGDIIAMVGNRRIGTLDDYENLVKSIEPGKGVALYVVRGDEKGYVVVKP